MAAIIGRTSPGGAPSTNEETVASCEEAITNQSRRLDFRDYLLKNGFEVLWRMILG